MTERHLSRLAPLAPSARSPARPPASARVPPPPTTPQPTRSPSAGPTCSDPASDAASASEPLDAIHSVSIEPNGTGGFETVTVDAGTVTQAGTSSVTIKEGSSNATYASPTITPHGKLTVTLDGKSSTLSALATGDWVIVAQSSAGTNRVTALDSSATSTTWNGGPSNWGSDQSGPGWQGYGTAGAWHGSVNEYGPPSGPGGAQGW
jgi:hypothetical protein